MYAVNGLWSNVRRSFDLLLSKERWKGLRVIRRQETIAGEDVWVELPFRYRDKHRDVLRKYVDGHEAGKVEEAREVVPLQGLISTQGQVLARDVQKYLRSRSMKGSSPLPVVFEDADGLRYILDGNHRLTAAWIRGERQVKVILARIPRPARAAA